MVKRKLVTIFTRDFMQWTNQLLRDQIVLRFPSVWGIGLEDQIVYYDGRTAQWNRYEDDYIKLGAYMSSQVPLDHPIFQEETHTRYREQVRQLREMIQISVEEIQDEVGFLQEILDIQNDIYPYYTLSVFVPGPWREQFIAHHGEDAHSVLDILFESREYSEGVFKMVDLYLRNWLGSRIEQAGHPRKYIKILSVEELQHFVATGSLPSPEALEKRSRGYVYIGGEIIPVDNVDMFFVSRDIEQDTQSTNGVTHFSGTVACKGDICEGVVQTILTTEEAQDFKEGNILVTSMTSPEYLPAMKKAKAIITDEGGLTCHAAITSREIGVPCIIGTRIATKVLTDGDRVTVDAEKGIITKI